MLRMLPYHRDYAPVFDRLNRAWIEEYFTVEPLDELVLTQPEKYIIAPGGEIWFAELNGEIIGCCALLNLEPAIMEFTKLGVDPVARGEGVAKALLQHCIARAGEKGAHTLRIFTSTSLVPANTLYRSVGFIERAMSAEQLARYVRGDVMYDYPLANITAARA